MAVNWSAIAVKLEAALNAALDSPSPNYTINGQSVSFADYIDMLRKQLVEVEKLAASSGTPIVIKKRALLG